MKKKKIIDYDLIEKQAYESYLNLKKDNDKDFKLDNFILNLATKYIDKHLEKPEYVSILNTLVNLEDNNSIINYLDRINYPINKLESSITSFIVNFRPDLFIASINYIYSLEKKIKIYKEYLRKKEIQRKQAEKYKPEEVNQAIKLITKYINDDLPTKRFCWEHSIQRNQLEKKANIIKHFNTSLYDAFISKKEELDLYTIKNIDNDVRKILELIKNQTNDKPFDHLTYFLTTKFSFREIVDQGDIILNNEDAKILRNQLTFFYNHFTIYNERDIKWFQDSYITINVDGQILEFTNQEKQMALSYLVTNNIPISYDTLTEVFIKKYKEIKNKETKEEEFKNIFQTQYEIAKQAYQLYENCKGNTIDLSRAARKMNMKKNVFFSYVRMYLLENSKEHIFDQIYETIIHMENNEQIINYLNSINAPAIALEDNLIFYVCNYRPDILYGKKHNLESLRKKIALYVTYKETLPKSTKEIAYYDKIKDFAHQMIHSEYSLKRIACNRQILSDGVKRCKSTLKITDPTLYHDFITSIEVKGI